MKDLLLAFAQALVDQPRRVSVSERGQGGTTILSLSVAPEDRGKVIGREGRTYQKVAPACAASRSGFRVSRQSQIIPRIEISGREAIRAPNPGDRLATSETAAMITPESAALMMR